MGLVCLKTTIHLSCLWLPFSPNYLAYHFCAGGWCLMNAFKETLVVLNFLPFTIVLKHSTTSLSTSIIWQGLSHVVAYENPLVYLSVCLELVLWGCVLLTDFVNYHSWMQYFLWYQVNTPSTEVNKWRN